MRGACLILKRWILDVSLQWSLFVSNGSWKLPFPWLRCTPRVNMKYGLCRELKDINYNRLFTCFIMMVHYKLMRTIQRKDYCWKVRQALSLVISRYQSAEGQLPALTIPHLTFLKETYSHIDPHLVLHYVNRNSLLGADQTGSLWCLFVCRC